MKRYTFHKPEHLCMQRDIEALFSAGSHAATAYPLRAVFRQTEAGRGPAVQVLLSVAKRRLHHAVDRNRAKRQLREAYRLNKYVLLDSLPAGCHLHLGFIWLADRPMPTERVAASMRLLLQRIADKSHRRAATPENGTITPENNSNNPENNADNPKHDDTNPENAATAAPGGRQ